LERTAIELPQSNDVPFVINPKSQQELPSRVNDIIQESRLTVVPEINEEIRSALAALNPAGQLAVAGD
jgi:hypothetical protein